MALPPFEVLSLFLFLHFAMAIPQGKDLIDKDRVQRSNILPRANDSAPSSSDALTAGLGGGLIDCLASDPPSIGSKSGSCCTADGDSHILLSAVHNLSNADFALRAFASQVPSP